MDSGRAKLDAGLEKLRGASAVADAFWMLVIEERDVGSIGVDLFQVLIDTLHSAHALFEECEHDVFGDAICVAQRAGK